MRAGTVPVRTGAAEPGDGTGPVECRAEAVQAARSALPSRRTVFRAAGTVGVAAAAGGLAACGEQEPPADQFAAAQPATVPVAEVEVGSGTIVDQTYVVAQPREGEFYAYSSVCPHQGCQVRQITEADITCPCHNSIFSVEDGSVLTGPAESGLTPAEVTVEGDSLTVAPAAG
ncbi:MULTISPECIES: Rieske (2Fe-2S) protein [Brevibacterium]|uniref:Rieske (2Fe-2S) protein n=1 Tax=Brevibacterium TaxID=1696 RepID=UPI0025BBAFE2|nr:Rieske (2Fe-2S) protein [Brevibacterium sp.]